MPVGLHRAGEIAFFILRQRGIPIVAVLESSPEGRRFFMGQPVLRLDALPRLACDGVVIASFQDTRHLRSQLATWGVLGAQIIAIPDRRAFAELPQVAQETGQRRAEPFMEAVRP